MNDRRLVRSEMSSLVATPGEESAILRTLFSNRQAVDEREDCLLFGIPGGGIVLTFLSIIEHW